MKLGKLFFDRPLGMTAGHAEFNMIPVTQGSPQGTSLVFEWPIVGKNVPFVTRSILPDGQPYWNMGLWVVTDEVLLRITSGPFLQVAETPVLATQQGVRFAQTVWTPVVRAFEGASVPFERMLGVWMNYPDVFYACIARHRPPSLLSRQNFYTVLRWPEWTYRRRTMQERVVEMEAAGHGGGKLSAATLSKRARDLGLA